MNHNESNGQNPKCQEDVNQYLERCQDGLRKLARKFKKRIIDPKFLAELIALAGLLIYTGYTIKMYRANRDSADAAKSAAVTAHDALIRGTRPWVGPSGEAKMDGVPTFDKDGNVSFSVEVPVKNFGTSPALNVDFDLEPDIPEIGPGSYRLKFINDRCKPDAVSKGKLIIFPGNETTFTTSGARSLPDLKGRPWFTLEGCILYTDQFQERTHHTRFCFVVPYLNKFPVHECGTSAD